MQASSLEDGATSSRSTSSSMYDNNLTSRRGREILHQASPTSTSTNGRLLNLEMPRKIPFFGERNGSCFRIGRRQGHRLQLHSLQSVIRLRRGLNSLQHVSRHRRRVSRHRRRVSCLHPLSQRAKSGSVRVPPPKVLCRRTDHRNGRCSPSQKYQRLLPRELMT